MIVIKRYPNRKLYDTEAKRYITLDGIAELIRQGAEVQVIDHTTNEDLTAVTLTQIIVEQEKKRGGFLPQSVLTGLVQAGGETLNTLRRSLTSPLGLFHQVDEEIEKRLQNLVNQGELTREEGVRLRDRLLAPGHREQSESLLSGKYSIEQLLSKRGIPTRDEIERLTNQIDDLSAKIDSLIDETETS
ncbi:MAG TPA: polyhydroxyalkanoate synthesis regulator DNA-binding domain-containing protein [Anaerolineae bacterium]